MALKDTSAYGPRRPQGANESALAPSPYGAITPAAVGPPHLAQVQQSSSTDSYAQAYAPLQDDAAYGQAVMGVQERTLCAPDGTQAREVISVRVPQRPHRPYQPVLNHAVLQGA